MKTPARHATVSRLFIRFRQHMRNDLLVLAVLAVIVGGLSGGAIVLFREAIILVQTVAFGSGAHRLETHLASLPWWWIVAAPTAGGLLVGILARWIAHGRRSSGVTDVIAASALRGGNLNIGRGLRTAVLDAVSIGVGGSVGREGPAVHLGASIGGAIAQWLRMTRSVARSLMGCGVAAAVAASFNAPLAGALFANEVVIGHYALSSFAPIVVASLVGTMVSRAYFGDFPAFILDLQVDLSFWEFPIFALLGLLAAGVALAFIRGVDVARLAADKVPGPTWIRPAVGGLIIGVMALAVPQILGLGYGMTESALTGSLPLMLLAALVLAKLVATCISHGFGFWGGVFSPSLAIGAVLGGTVGVVVQMLFPEAGVQSGAYAIAGMGAVAGAVLGAPVSTTLIIFEMTGNYALTMAVMLAVVVASILTKQWFGYSYFTWQLAQRGMDVRREFETVILRAITAETVMKRTCGRIEPGAGLRAIRAAIQNSDTGLLFVIDEEEHLRGTITLAGLSDAAFDTEIDDLVTATDAARPTDAVVNAHDDLATVLDVFRETKATAVAVLEADTSRFLGCIREIDAVLASHKALIARHQERQD